ncbi:PQQ-like beta-propeller repeat protein [Streptomyces sp. NBC_01275]|uniref:outer membrane protein assembly factor BamB family protein n=1 Tax=Streptomyces sp. NBC_01275 TaxID=2903807 RepID=UPI00224CB63F|nr:PQQ-binding-like beta-propeller repeat protein [Streptomyces sp. NBC_01275]MCX4767846.1 PQQ-like beta-propeller repeat protein [Streptomyces sp. NBC_01275]
MRRGAARHGHRAVRLLVLALGVALLGACDDGGADRPPGGTAGATSAAGSPSAVAATPTARGGPPTGLREVAHGSGRAVVTDDLVVALSSTGAKCILAAMPLAAPDTEKWRVVGEIDGARLGCTPGAPALAGSTLVLPYASTTAGEGIEAGSSEQGAIGLHLDGTESWRTPIAGVDTVIGSTDRFALVTDKRESLPGSDEKHLTAVVDAETGKVLWQKSGLRAYGIDGDTVIVANPEIDTVTALDAATGRQRWTSVMYPRGGLAVTGAGVVAVPVKADPDSIGSYDAEIVLRDTRSGAVLHTEAGPTGFPTCVSDGRTAVVCRTSGGAEDRRILFAYDLTSRRRSWSVPAKRVADAEIEPRSMVDGRVFFATKTGGALVDAGTGNKLAHSLSGAPDLVRGVYGVDNGDRYYTVFLVTS